MFNITYFDQSKTKNVSFPEQQKQLDPLCVNRLKYSNPSLCFPKLNLLCFISLIDLHQIFKKNCAFEQRLAAQQWPETELC